VKLAGVTEPVGNLLDGLAAADESICPLMQSQSLAKTSGRFAARGFADTDQLRFRKARDHAQLSDSWGPKVLASPLCAKRGHDAPKPIM